MTYTAEEKAAIKAYKGPIHKIPRGQSSMPSARWDEKQGKLRNAHHCGRFLNHEEAKAMFKMGAPKNPNVQRRRNRAAELAETMTTREIAAHLGVTADLVREDLKQMGVKAKPIDRRGIGATQRSKEMAAKRREKVQKLFKAGTTKPTDIAEKIGGDRRTIRRDLVRLGLIEGRS